MSDRLRSCAPSTEPTGPRSWVRTLLADLDVVVERDPSVLTRREALLAPYLPALWLHRVAVRWHISGHRTTARALAVAGRLLSGGVDIHPGARIGERLFIDHGAAVVVGETAVIGEDVTIYHQVTLGALGWRRDRLRMPGERRHPVIGNRVQIGTNASVLGPVVVGDDASIAAHCCVVADVPAGATVHPATSHVRVGLLGSAEARR